MLGEITSQSLTSLDAKASALCIEGNGPPMTGGGKLVIAKADKDFIGKIEVSADCALSIKAAKE